MSHQLHLRVRFYELDPYNHVNHSAYIQYFEAGRVEALASVGMGLDHLQRLGTNLLVTAIRTRFVQPAVLGDDLLVESGVSAIGRAKATWLQRISREGDVLVTQEVVSGCTNSAGRPTRFSAELVDALAPCRVEPDWLGRLAPRS